MLTPEKLSSYEFNKVVEIYNQLNIDISSDIIRRIEKMGDITEASKYQIKKLVQLNGKEIFNKALLETAKLDSETVSELKSIYEDMAKVDIQGFKEIYDYRDKPFELTASQYQILNEGVKATNKELKNFTKSIAFNSQQLYISSVDKAYNKVVTGAFDYNTAIKQAYKEVAEQGIVLQDSIGRNVKLDVAVRRNVLSGIQSTANNMNRDVEDYLGTDGYEVTAHLGARESHARHQGQQYALTKKDAKKYGVGYWKEIVDSELGLQPISDLWNDYNCRHTYFGIILGISEPSYSKDELNTFINEEVSYNGTKIPIYEATQMQRSIERNIRNAKRELATLESANQDTSSAKIKLKKFQKEYTKFTNETGLIKQNERVAISKNIENKTIDKQQKINDLLQKRKELELKKANLEIKEDLSKPIVSNKKNIIKEKIIKIENKDNMNEEYLRLKNIYEKSYEDKWQNTSLQEKYFYMNYEKDGKLFYKQLLQSRGIDTTEWNLENDFIKKTKSYSQYEKNNSEIISNKYNDTINNLNIKEKEILNKYTTSYYMTVNGQLRGYTGVDSTNKIKQITDVLNKTSLVEDTKLYRKIGVDGFSDLTNVKINNVNSFSTDELRKMFVGKEYKDNAFISTSTVDRGFESGGIHMQLYAPKGTKGTYINEISEYKNIEYEMLLQRGTKFKIIDVVKDEDENIIRIIAEVENGNI